MILPAVSSEERRTAFNQAREYLQAGDHRSANPIFERLVQESRKDIVQGLALYQLGLAYMRGLGYEQDNDLAVHYILSSAKAGYAGGMHDSALIYWSGLCGIVADRNEAERYFVDAIATAKRMNERPDVPQHHKNALEAFRRSAEAKLSELRFNRRAIKGMKALVGIVGAIGAGVKAYEWMSSDDDKA